MRILKVTRNRITKSAVAEIAAVLAAGGVVAYPTETAYGLAADPRNAKAMRRVFAIKARPKNMPLPFIAASAEAVRERFVLKGAAAKLAERHWPAPLTLVLDVRKGGGFGKEKDGAVRVPRSAWARAVAEAAGGIVTSTSANVSGENSLFSGKDVARAFAGRAVQPDLIVDAGGLKPHKPSTIARVGARGEIEILRQGCFEIKEAKRKNV